MHLVIISGMALVRELSSLPYAAMERPKAVRGHLPAKETHGDKKKRTEQTSKTSEMTLTNSNTTYEGGDGAEVGCKVACGGGRRGRQTKAA